MGAINVACQDCDWTGTDDQCKEISDFHERVSPGEICPYGQCPECGALCHAEEEDYIPSNFYLACEERKNTARTKAFPIVVSRDDDAIKIDFGNTFPAFKMTNKNGEPIIEIWSSPNDHNPQHIINMRAVQCARE